MYEVIEHWKQYKLEKQIEPIKNFCKKKKILKEFDEWMERISKKNGTTKY